MVNRQTSAGQAAKTNPLTLTPVRDLLPIDPLLPDVAAALRSHQGLVIQAPAGSGKTTRVPSALLEAGLAGSGEIVVLEPRRLAARLAARRIAYELGEVLGQTVGYQVRFEDVSSSRTRIRLVTEGILNRRLLVDRNLEAITIVVLDEFHERSIQTDLALSALRALQQGARPDLRVVVMSATVETAPVARFLGGCPVLSGQGQCYEVDIQYLAEPDDRPVDQQVLGAVRRLVREGLEGNVLVFLPGAAEIRQCRQALAALSESAGFDLVPLHGDLPLSDQDRALTPGDRPKVILSTNVAETSVTAEGVVAVVDSGLARRASHAPWSGLPRLQVAKVSQASAAQRAGRAGRTQPGRCLRLFTRRDHDARPSHEVPEIKRSDLTEPLLHLRALGVKDPRAFVWFEPPTAQAVEAADLLLRELGALDSTGQLSAIGREMLRYPLHPRLSRMLVEAERRGVVEPACVVASLLSERSTEAYSAGGLNALRSPVHQGEPTADSDVLVSLEQFERAQSLGFAAEALRAMGIRPGAAQSVDRTAKGLLRLAGRGRDRSYHPSQGVSRPRQDPDQAIRQCILAGFPDRVARRVRDRELALATGGSARLSEASLVRDAEYVVAVSAEERSEDSGRRVVVRTASGIQPEWLLELFPDAVRDSHQVCWDPVRKRAESIDRLLYGTLVLDEERRSDRADDEACAVLCAAAQAVGPRAFVDADGLDQWFARLEVVAQHAPEHGIPAQGIEDARRTLSLLCIGRRSFEELEQADLVQKLAEDLTPQQQATVERLAPKRVSLPSGRALPIHYAPGAEPWVESRLQDFFGMAKGPSIVQGRVPLVLHLLAPNKRAVQVTRDLGSFWENTYPAIRKELCRRYPKHAWPEDGRNACAPPPGRLRSS